MADNDNKPLGINLSTVGRFGAGGALTGAGLASALTFVKMLRDLSEEQKARHAIDEHTLTLTLPAKESAAKKKDEKDPKVKMDKSKAVEKPATTPKQIRSTDGKYNIKTANWQTMASSLLAMGAGGGLGFALVNKVYEHKKQRELERKLEGAKHEYMDMLAGPSTKLASEKGESTFSYMDYPLGLGALALLLGGGSTAWLTKKILDEYNKEPESQYKPVRQPKIQRIVFNTEGEQPAKVASAEPDTLAALCIYLDICSGSPDILGHEKCAEVMEQLGTTPEEMYKMAVSDYEKLQAYLHNNPEFRTVLKRLAMDRHPILKYLKGAVDWPIVGKHGDDKLYDTVRRAVGPEHEMFDAVKNEAAATRAMPKRAGVPDVIGGMLAGSAGATGAQLAFENKRKSKQEPAVQHQSPEEREAEIQDMVDHIDLKAEDRPAAEFAENNKDKIKGVLLMLAEEGKI
jgi:hypothetical protein